MFFKYYTMLVAMEESQEPVEQPTRWLIKPKERVRLLLKFFSEDSSPDAVRIPVGIRRIPQDAHLDCRDDRLRIGQIH